MAATGTGQARRTRSRFPVPVARGRDDEEALTAAIIRLASQYGRYGYRRINTLSGPKVGM